LARPDAARIPLASAVGGRADRATRVPVGGGTGAADAEAVLAGVAAETLVAAGSAVVRVGLRVDADAVADERLVDIRQDAAVVPTLGPRVPGRRALAAGAVLARLADVAALSAVVRVGEPVGARAPAVGAPVRAGTDTVLARLAAAADVSARAAVVVVRLGIDARPHAVGRSRRAGADEVLAGASAATDDATAPALVVPLEVRARLARAARLGC